MIAMQLQVLYIISIIVTVFVMTMLLAYALRRRYIPGAWYFISFIVPTMLWALNAGVTALAPPEMGYFWLSIKYLWIAVTPVALLLFVLDYTSRNARLNRWLIAGLLIIPAITQAVVWTNRQHGWMLREVQFAQVGILTYQSTVTYGPYYWVHTGYSYILSLLSMVLILTTIFRGSYLYRRQGLLLLAGLVATLVGNVLLIAKIAPREVDPMPFALLISCALIGWSMFRYHMLDLAPVARNVFIDTIPDCMLAIDGQGRIIDINKQMLALIGAQQSRIIGRPVGEVLKPWRDSVAPFRDATNIEAEIRIGSRQFDLLIIPLTDRRASMRGRLIVLHDITHRKELEAEREGLISTLRDALSEVKKLSGLLPICANCKKIRDDNGDWQQLEAFIRNHSEAQFSHGICPECLTTLYPDLQGAS